MIQKTVSPIDGQVIVERELASSEQIDQMVAKAEKAQRDWRATSRDKRRELLERFTDLVVSAKDELAEELCRQMGRPIRYCGGEIAGFEERSRMMLELGSSALSDIAVSEKAGFTRFIRREPVGVVLILAPWNYPYLTTVNTLIPALMAGNSVILKHSNQTPLVAEQLARLALEAGVPEGVLQCLHIDHDQVGQLIPDDRIAFAAFTGSVAGGRAVHRAAGGHFKAVGLELGGNDAGYVRVDANIDHAVETLVDGAFFNSGQSCCGIERIYVAEARFSQFVERFVELTNKYVLGSPLDQDTTIGPVVRVSAAEMIREQVDQAVTAGARKLINEDDFVGTAIGPTFLPPQVLVDVDQQMTIMREETFGPVVGIASVASDDEAILRINDSRYGLTASVFTSDEKAAIELGDRADVGTWFMNRCDYLDPELAWVGVKDSGRGCTLSKLGYESLTRPKSFHLKHVES